LTIYIMDLLINYVSQFQYLTIFAGSILLGESVIIPAILLSAQGTLNPWGVFSMSLAGTLLADIGWFLLGKRLLAFAGRFEWINVRYARFIQSVERRNERRRLILFMCFKFVYGIRILTIIYFSIQHMPFLRFLAIAAGGSVLWLAVVFGIVWTTWESASTVLPALRSIQYTLLGAVVFLILSRMFAAWLSKKIADR
jgi:membrane protein DedA with SNARE-associated domain